jgi:NAD-reducing hydrogenase small subunit
VEECLAESYLNGKDLLHPQVPNDPELPLLLDKVRPLHELVKVDYFLPGCPPSGNAFWKLLTDLAAGKPPALSYDLLHYD